MGAKEGEGGGAQAENGEKTKTQEAEEKRWEMKRGGDEERNRYTHYLLILSTPISLLLSTFPLLFSLW